MIRGLCVHTTGSGIVAEARRNGADPVDWAVDYYLRPDTFFPHYVCGWDGELVQVCDEDEVALHVGLSPQEKAAYQSGAWRGKINAAAWERAWPKRESPIVFYLGTSPNKAFVGLELLPLEARNRGADGLWFTPDQHRRVAELAADLFARHAIMPLVSRLVGHEDLNPLARWDGGGGWDPGARRGRPRFDWSRVLPRLGL